MNRSEYIRQLSSALGPRRVAYFGTRGADARTLTELPNFEQIFSQIAPSGLAGVDETCLESVTNTRVDLDAYSIDADIREHVTSLRGEMLDFFEKPSAVVPYRSCALLASACFPRGKVTHLGNFHEKQACFEHKPWVETSLADRGIRIVPWRYYADNDRDFIEESLDRNALVIRSNRSDGGTGVHYLSRQGALADAWPQHVDGFVAVAPFLDGLPLNVNACVFSDGSVAMFGASFQLIGIPTCTRRRFGYCGNDFASVRDLGNDALAELDTMVRAVGRWLAEEGYRGAFGIDALLVAGQMYLVELNPRFQGSSRLSADADAADGRADMFLAHLGAFLNLGIPDEATLEDLARRGGASHIVVHASHDGTYAGPCRAPRGFAPDLEPERDVHVEVGGMILNLVFRGGVIQNGYTLSDGAEAAIQAAVSCFSSSGIPRVANARSEGEQA